MKKNEKMMLSGTDIQWHPGFCAAADIELSANRSELDFEREYSLSKKPLQIDLLVIKKAGGARTENEIGHIFRRYNIVEYKSPDDGMTIDDFFKTVGYACIYKGLGDTVDQIPLSQLTVSLFRENYPRELFCHLRENGFTVEQEYSGVYYIKGLFLLAQVVVTRELEGPRHRSLRILSRNALEEDIRGFTEETRKLTGQRDRENVDAVLQVSVAANSELYEKMTGRFSDMNDALRWLMRDEIEAGVQKGIREGMEMGMQEGIQKGMLRKTREIAYELHDMGLPTDKIARAVKVNTETVQEWFAEQAALAR